MARRIKLGKIAIVIFITVLIWVGADLALDETLTVSGVPITVAKSTDPSLWVSFDDQPTASIDSIVLEGPVSKISEVRRGLNDGSLQLEFFLDARQEGMVKAANYPLDVLSFLRRSEQIDQHSLMRGLMIKSCEPRTLNVKVVKLEKKTLPVECFDESAMPLKAESIKPAVVDIFVPANRALTARVQLTRREVERARVKPIQKVPYVRLGEGQIREAAVPVEIKLLPEGRLNEHTVGAPRLMIGLSMNLQGRYKVKIENEPEVLGAIKIRATAEAKRAYESQPYQVLLSIVDTDAKAESVQRKNLDYLFPEEFVRKDEIMLDQTPTPARFSLIPLTTKSSDSGGK